MKKKLIFSLLAILATNFIAYATYNKNEELNKKLRNCTPTKNFDAGGGNLYQIYGVKGYNCNFKIDFEDASLMPDIICSIPFSKMKVFLEMGQETAQIRDQYCRMDLEGLKRLEKAYR